MADALVPGRTGAMNAAAATIRDQAKKKWALVLVPGGATFNISTAQSQVQVDGKAFTEILQSVIDETMATDDAFIREIISSIEKSVMERVITDLFFMMFFSHELLHIYQQLGSSQYKDSDHYMEAVGVVDYQADLAAFWFIFKSLDRTAGLSERQHLGLMIALHIFTMNAFNLGEGGRTSKEGFDRLLIWYFQLSRIIGSETEPNLSHPSLQVMPVVAFPRIGPMLLERLQSGLWAGDPADWSEVGHDMVVALCDGKGIQRILRMTATDPQRPRRLIDAVLTRNLASVREELEEFFQLFDQSLDFVQGDATIFALEAARASAERLVHRQVTRLIALNESDVRSFFNEAERLIIQRNPRLRGEGLDDVRREWEDGVQPALERLLIARIGPDWRREAAREKVSDVLKWEVLRVANRLSSSLDLLLEESV
jgi:uncharacterized protein (DUF1778 family)